MSRIVAVLIAAGAGSLMAWQGTLNSFLARRATLAGATLIVHTTGTVLAAAVVVGLLIAGRFAAGWEDLLRAPPHAYLGGPLGVAIIWGVAAGIGRVGAAPATTAIVAAQVATAAFLDHFGLLGLETVPVSPQRSLGLLLLAAGTWLVLGEG